MSYFCEDCGNDFDEDDDFYYCIICDVKIKKEEVEKEREDII